MKSKMMTIGAIGAPTSVGQTALLSNNAFPKELPTI